MDYTNTYRYIVLHEVTKPKNNVIKDIIGGNTHTGKMGKDGSHNNKKFNN